MSTILTSRRSGPNAHNLVASATPFVRAGRRRPRLREGRGRGGLSRHLAPRAVAGHHRRVEATLDDIMRQLDGIGRLLMSIDATLKLLVKHLREDDDGEEETDT